MNDFYLAIILGLALLAIGLGILIKVQEGLIAKLNLRLQRLNKWPAKRN